ncbi:MAG: type II toxin-antitoxin system RelE/ParE family toxin [Terriglobales bacterium]
MKIRWTRAAVHQLTLACDYIAADNPSAAEKLRAQILAQVKQLSEYPLAGRTGRVTDTRELVIVNTPYLIAYRITPRSEVHILAVLHGKRRWPEAS